MSKDATPTIRCALYTRKSVTEGLDQDFNSLDAQREAGEAFIASQAGEGWTCLADRYDDGGFTGANVERPALMRLMRDIEAGKIDTVVVYKVDRLSRSLIDFGRLMETFENHGVSFVSVTQSFNTSNSMGRLTLNILLSFAQFERELISERTRDKIAATRRKGKWSGGRPILGYDVDRGAHGTNSPRLVVKEEEAVQVRAIFDLYLELASIRATASELNRRGWRTKAWTTRKGKPCGGSTYVPSSLFTLLTNVLYIGQVRYREEVHEGEHEAIIDPGVWKRVQAQLASNGVAGGSAARNKHGALLKGLIRCRSCGCAMTHTYSTKGSKQYRYYVCAKAQRHGWHECPTKSVRAGDVEGFVIDQIKVMVGDPAVTAAALEHAREQRGQEISRLQTEQRLIERALKERDEGDVTDTERRRLREITGELEALRDQLINDDEVARGIAELDNLVTALGPRDRARLVHLLIARVEYDGESGEVTITYNGLGLDNETPAEAAA